LLLGMTKYFSDWNKSSEWCVPQSNPRIFWRLLRLWWRHCAWVHARCQPARIKLIQQISGRYVMCIMHSWHLACAGIPHLVTSNPVTSIFYLN
jgi:hypothetical protein